MMLSDKDNVLMAFSLLSVSVDHTSMSDIKRP